MNENELGESLDPKSSGKNPGKPKAKEEGPQPLFAAVPAGRALVIVPEDLNERRKATEALEHALEAAPNSRAPRVFTSLNLKRLDESFAIYTAVVDAKGRFKLSAATLTGNHTKETASDGLGDDIDFGVRSESVRVLDLSSIVNSIQRGIGPTWRTAFYDGTVRLLNT